MSNTPEPRWVEGADDLLRIALDYREFAGHRFPDTPLHSEAVAVANSIEAIALAMLRWATTPLVEARGEEEASPE